MNNFKIYSAVIISMIFWAFSFIWYKVANEFYPPITIVFIRLVISVILLTTYLLLAGKFMKIKKYHWKLFFMMAVFEPFFYFIGESYGLTYVSSTVGSVIISTIPVIASLGALIFFREKLKLINYAGIIISFIGILVFILKKDGSLSFNIKGLAFLCLAVVAAAGYNLTLSRLVSSYSPVYIVNVQNIIGAILFLPLFIILDFRNFLDTPHTFESLKPILGLAVFASCGAFILFAYSVKNIGISKAIFFTYCIPVLTAVFSFLLMGDKLNLQNIIGMIIVIAGLILSQLNGKKKSIDEALILTGKTA
jgi:drug/metabolite transporter (DMT)-like permease